MFIVNQERDRVINIDNTASIHLSNNGQREKWICATTSIYETVLGRYESERAKEVFKQMLDECFAPVDKVELFCWYMPEK